MRIFYVIGFLALAAPAWAGEYAVLGNGLRLHADRHDTDGSTVKLYSGEGSTEMPAGSIVRFEPDEKVETAAAPSPAPPVPGPPPAADAPPAGTPRELAAWAARKYSLPESFVQSVMKTESGFEPSAVSPKGAMGLMQLMPETARRLGVDPKNPLENAAGGAQYLHDLLAKYESDPDQVLLALAAYNAGPAAVDRYHGVPPYPETRQYILRVLKNWDRSSEHK